MPHSKKTKSSFPHDDQGRAILGSAKEMAAWVKLGFEEQYKSKSQSPSFEHRFIASESASSIFLIPSAVKPRHPKYSICATWQMSYPESRR